jgi:hypothetical protein
MLKQFLIIGFVIVFASCGRRKKDEEIMAKMLNETFVNASKSASLSSDVIYYDFDSKIQTLDLKKRDPI